MDTLTHILLTYGLLMLLFNWRPFPRSQVVPLLIGAVIPDLDYFFNLIGVSATWLTHRGIFHSLVMNLVFAFIIGLILSIPKIRDLVWTKTFMYWWVIMLLVYAGEIIHILFDMLLPSGLMLFFPFSFEMIQGSNLPIHAVYGIVLGIIVGIILSQPLYINHLPKFERCPYTRFIKIIGVIIPPIFLILSLVWFFTSQTNWVILVTILCSFLLLETFTILQLRSDIKI